ncbi:hypothetical protein EMCRGX_G010605 [Ephydatia muelleri]
MSKFGEPMKGLQVFISDIRNCKSKEAEKKRINKELGNIRSQFKTDKLDGYQKKKYVCKLLFIFLLGNDVDFGHQEAVNLLSSNHFSEKQIGYLFVSVLIGESNELFQLIVQAIRNDLESSQPDFITLAMQCVANVASKEMAEQLGKDIAQILVAPESTPEVKQTAALCLLRLVRANPKVVPYQQTASRMCQLLNERQLGVVTASTSLLIELATLSPDLFTECISLGLTRLSKLVTSNTDLHDYSYYFVPAPWLCVKLMQLLQRFPIPEDAIIRSKLSEALEAVINRAQEPGKSKKIQYANAKNAVLFEAINLIIHFDGDPSLQVRACNLLGTYLTHKETNMRYLSLESLGYLAASEFSHEAVKKHQEVVLKALQTEKDISVRQKAIDLLYAMCDNSNSVAIVAELLRYLETADYSIRETLVLKIAILAEKYADEYSWYVDTILKLIRLAGDYVSEDVWYRVIQIVINRQDIQGYAAKTCFEALLAPACHENMIKVGGYILGEFGNLIAGDVRSSPLVQFQLLHSKFHFCSIPTRALLLSSYMKFINLFPEIKPQIQEVLSSDTQLRNSDAELQQRAVEYLKLSSVASTDVLALVLEEMPPFAEKESSLLSKLHKSAPWTAKLHNVSSGTPAPAPGATQEQKTQQPLVTMQATPTPVTSTQAPLISMVEPVAAASKTTAAPTATDLLVDVFGDLPPPQLNLAAEGMAAPSELTPGAEDGYERFWLKNNGILFENEVLQIGIKSEYKKNLGRVGVFYGNKTKNALSGFSTSITSGADILSLCPRHGGWLDTPPIWGLLVDVWRRGFWWVFRGGASGGCLEEGASGGCLEEGLLLSFQEKPFASSVDSGAQVQQVINVECLAPFFEAPRITIKFSIGGVPRYLLLKLPIMLSKFLEPLEMAADQFFQRWKQLGSPNQESQKIFDAQHPIIKSEADVKLQGFGLSVLSKIDPNEDNHVAAGLVNTKSQPVGCLLRLEPNKATKKYRLTIRTSHEGTSKMFGSVLSKMF